MSLSEFDACLQALRHSYDLATGLTRSQIAEGAGCSPDAVRRALRSMLELPDPWVDADVGEQGMVWWLRASGRAAVAQAGGPRHQ